jgi:hypothetical protein
MGLFTKKQANGKEVSVKDDEKSQQGTRKFGFGRNKPSADSERLAPPSTPWTPESSSAQQSNATSALTSRRNSFTSVRSSVLKELKYEAMVNHLFQQQCSKSCHMLVIRTKLMWILGRLWLNDASGDIEGVLLRKSRGVYTTCPPTLAQSALAEYCSRLNLQVRVGSIPQLCCSNRMIGGTDGQFSCHSNLH